MNIGAVVKAISGLGSVAQGVSGLFGHKNKGASTQTNPADSANPYYSQIPEKALPYYKPYMEVGQDALRNLTTEYGRMTNNPEDLYNKFGSGYKESAGYQTRLQSALQAAQNASAAGGMLGTPQYQQQAAQIANDMSAKDYEDYLNHILGIYGGGIQGQQGIENQGYDASKAYANLLGNAISAQGQNAYAGQAGQNAAQAAQNAQNQQNRAQSWGNIYGGLDLGGKALTEYLNKNNDKEKASSMPSTYDWSSMYGGQK
jgi:hypothetical protein